MVASSATVPGVSATRTRGDNRSPLKVPPTFLRRGTTRGYLGAFGRGITRCPLLPGSAESGIRLLLCSRGRGKQVRAAVLSAGERVADQLEHRPTAAFVGVARRRDDATGEHGLAGGAQPASACTAADVPATHVHPGYTEELHGGTGCLDLPAGPFRRTGVPSTSKNRKYFFFFFFRSFVFCFVLFFLQRLVN